MKSNSCLLFLICWVWFTSGSTAQDRMMGISRVYEFDVTNNNVPEGFAERVKEGKYYALIMGVKDYEDWRNFPQLDHPLRDAERLMRILQRQYLFEPEQTTFLKNPRKEAIIQALADLEKKVRSVDNVLIFYAGHGTLDTLDGKENGFWLPADARKHDMATWLPNSTVREYIQKIKSKHTLLLADACFSGSIFKTRGLGKPAKRELAKEPGSGIAYASKVMQQTYELPSRKALTSGALREVPDQSAFIVHLVERLANYQFDFLPAERLYYRVKESVINDSRDSQMPQYGEIAGANSQGGDFIFIKRK